MLCEIVQRLASKLSLVMGESNVKKRRQEQIFEYVSLENAVSVARLSEIFRVSQMTIRRDLDELEKQGLIVRVPGGAMSGRGGRAEPTYKVRVYLNAHEKKRIAEAAEVLVEDDDLIFLDLGSTCLELASCLGRRHVTVVTNWLPNMIELARGGQCDIFNTGGRICNDELCSIGVTAFNAVSQFRFDKVFIGVGGIDSQGISDFRLESVAIKKQVIECAKETIVLADHSKFGRKAPIWIAPLSVAHKVIVCDCNHVKDQIQTLESMGIQVIGIGNGNDD